MNMKHIKWLLLGLIVLSPFTLAGGARAGSVFLDFPNTPPEICDTVNFPAISPMPDAKREYIRSVFNDVYPRMVALYGDPLTEGDGALGVKVYKVNSDDAMYLTHKSEAEIRAVLVAIVALLGGVSSPIEWTVLLGCAATTDVPDKAIFIKEPDIDPSVPGDRDENWEHLFTHELAHPFHDRLSYFDFFTHSWVEEGMAEAVAELVSAERGLRDASYSMWDTLKRYDARIYPQNGSWDGDANFHVLGASRFFFGGIASPPAVGVTDQSIFNRVISPKVRYEAAAGLWLLLTQHFSDPTKPRPDFLMRINDYIRVHGIGRATPAFYTPSPATFPAIETVVGPDATMEGQPLRTWLARHPFLKGPAWERSYAFIDVANPENLDLTRGDQVTVYAIYAVSDLPNLLPFPDRGELPAKNCLVRLEVRDVEGDLRALATGTTDGRGAFVVPALPAPPLEPGGYVLRAEYGDCDVIAPHVGEGFHAAGSAETFAVVRTNQRDITGPESGLFGVYLNSDPEEHRFLGSWFTPVGADTLAISFIDPAPVALPVSDFRAAFEVTTIGSEFLVGQWTDRPDVRLRLLTKPSPYARVVYNLVVEDFLIGSDPDSLRMVPGQSDTATVILHPNGVSHSEVPPGCSVSLIPSSPLSGIRLSLPEPTVVRALSILAPEDTFVELGVEVDATVSPGEYTIDISGFGLPSGTGGCDDLERTAQITLTVPVTVPAVQIDALIPAPVAPGQPVLLQGSFTDESWLDTHSGLIDWGDGEESVATFSDLTHESPEATGKVSGTHTYLEPGTYTVTLTVTDSTGASGSASMSLTVDLSPNLPGMIKIVDQVRFLSLTGTLPGTLGSATWQWRNGYGAAERYWIYQGLTKEWFFFFIKNRIPNYNPKKALGTKNNNFIAVAVKRADFEKWFWCGISLYDSLGRFTGYGCHPEWGPGLPDISAPWVQSEIDESLAPVVDVLSKYFGGSGP